MATVATDPKLEGSRPLVAGPSLWQFRAPRYWPAWLLVAWIRLTACLPWRFAIRVHCLIGRFFWLLLPRQRRIVKSHIERSFPELGRREVRALTRQNFENLGACLAEAAFAWCGKVSHSLAPFHVEGDEHVYSALAKGRGVILYTGHFTAVEICAPILKEMFPTFGFMFNPRRNALLNEIQRRGRLHSTHLSFPSTDVRSMLRALKRNSVIWYAPDQSFSERGSAVLPFFGEPATISTATCRLARASGAAIVPFSYRRLEDDSGYVLQFEPEIEDLGDDEVAGTERLLEVMARFIRQCPAQYAWTHRHLKNRPD